MFHDNTEFNETGEANVDLILLAVNERDELLAEVARLQSQLVTAKDLLRGLIGTCDRHGLRGRSYVDAREFLTDEQEKTT